MKILLLGEYSALHKNLKEGLVELGHDVKILAYGDGFKRIPVDISLDSNRKGLMRKLDLRIKKFKTLAVAKDFDVVQLINPFALKLSFFPEKYFLSRIIKSNKKFFLLGAGSDAYYWRYSRNRLSYGPFDDFLKYDVKSDHYYMESDSAFKFNEWVLRNSDGIIPITYEYEVAYRDEKELMPTIPVPINVDEVSYSENILGKKLKIFHGLSRYGLKGTHYVERAFQILLEKYPNDLELIIGGNMPLDQYLQVLNRANIVIDQLNSYSLGLTGLYAMAMGKVVMGGAEPESLTSLGVLSSPVINLKPDENHIVSEVEKLLCHKECIARLGAESRAFVEAVHNHKKVAQQYVDVWTRNF